MERADTNETGNEKKLSLWERVPWGWLGLLLGAGLGLADFGFMWSMGADLTFEGQDVSGVVFTAFAVTYGTLGFAVGRVILGQFQARRDSALIKSQMKQLQRAQYELVQQEKMAAIGRLAAGVAHEVRNPLGVIRASSSIVQESFEAGDERHRACEFICEEIDRLDSLISGLLDFSRPSQPRLQRVEPENVINHAVHLAHDELETRNIALKLDLDRRAGSFKADPDLLSQVVLDLILNAAQALEKEGEIIIRCRRAKPDMLIDVADSGPGVAPDEAAQVFEAFFTTKASGTGLGLPMAQRIVEAHSGRLESLTGQGAGPDGSGACFRVRVPLTPSSTLATAS